MADGNLEISAGQIWAHEDGRISNKWALRPLTSNQPGLSLLPHAS